MRKDTERPEEEDRPRTPHREEAGGEPPDRDDPPETARHPSPGVKHEPEPDAENLIPAEDEPGTF